MLPSSSSLSLFLCIDRVSALESIRNGVDMYAIRHVQLAEDERAEADSNEVYEDVVAQKRA